MRTKTLKEIFNKKKTTANWGKFSHIKYHRKGLFWKQIRITPGSKLIGGKPRKSTFNFLSYLQWWKFEHSYIQLMKNLTFKILKYLLIWSSQTRKYFHPKIQHDSNHSHPSVNMEESRQETMVTVNCRWFCWSLYYPFQVQEIQAPTTHVNLAKIPEYWELTD